MSSWKLSLIAVPALAVILGLALAYMGSLPQSILDLLGMWTGDAARNTTTPKTFILSQDPFVVYIRDFISPQEAAHLVQLACVCAPLP
jgi:hypothetical protein